MSQKYGRPHTVLAYVLTSAALVAAFAAGPASMPTGTAAKAGISANPLLAPTCWPKKQCGDDCCAYA